MRKKLLKICRIYVGGVLEQKFPKKQLSETPTHLSCFLVIHLGHYILIKYLMKVNRTKVL